MHLVADVLANMRSALNSDDASFTQEELKKLARQENIQAPSCSTRTASLPRAGNANPPEVDFPGRCQDEHERSTPRE